jgi:hypothetical protein
MLSVSDSEIRLRDLGSTNGTIVNGTRVEGEIVIRHGDLVQVGPLGFKVLTDVPAPAVAAVGAAPATGAAIPRPAVVGKIGRNDAAEADIEHWLLGDSKHEIPQSDSQVYGGDTQMDTKVVRAQDTDTQAEMPAGGPPPVDPVEAQPAKSAAEEEKVVEAEGGAKIKIKAQKQVIEKTREDTSRAAADILKKMLERRPK